MSRPLVAEISRSAFLHNVHSAQRIAGNAKLMVVLKADAYGHGAIELARTLNPATCIALTCVEEASELRAAGIENQCCLLEGIFELEELAWCHHHNVQLMLHSRYQLELVERYLLGLSAKSCHSLGIWLKFDSGMHRLGFDPSNVNELVSTVQGWSGADLIGVSTHMASADDPSDPSTNRQYRNFVEHILPVVARCPADILISVANSATLMNFPEYVHDTVRPGIMLYGGSCRKDHTGIQLGFRPVMRLKARVIAKRQIPVGDGVGYGQRWKASKASSIAVISLGYADGYPRHAPDGMPIAIRGQRVPVVGRVSMDMLCADITGFNVEIGDEVELWGENISIDEVADRAGTISYELMTSITKRVGRRIID